VAAGDTGRTFVSAGIAHDGRPDIRVKNQHGEIRIVIEPQPLGQVVFRVLDPSNGGVLGSAIVLTAEEPLDLRDERGAPIMGWREDHQ
jgi:hypothetical protein